ncbi:MAG: radical SAM protein [Verrucomicrobiae bacterium]|nr:radical SAM protein [Verrucomicrobiae bacterium]
MKRKIFFADLTHTAQGMNANTFPFGISCVVSYVKQKFQDQFDYQLFKFPDHLDQALTREMPWMLCFSNYSWNMELAYTFARLAKERSPSLITVFGGPNFPIEDGEKKGYLALRPGIDFNISLEGEIGLSELLLELSKRDFDVRDLKQSGIRIKNTDYLSEGRLVSGPSQRIHDVNELPSPYLTGVLDEFFKYPLQPMLETTRGCPFTCSFCADGLREKSKVTRYHAERVREEIHYIAQRIRNVDELIITDLNFAMYEEDIQTARVLAEVQEKFKWPLLISASAGKNKPHRTIEVARILNGTWNTGASVQSSDNEVLKAIKRSNISQDAYSQLIDFGNSLKGGRTHSEIILALPADTREKHYESLRYAIDHGVSGLRMFQAMLLRGTDMATLATREKYGLVSKFRTIPGSVGIYRIFNEDHPVAEIEEIIVANNTMSFEDYLDCRIMNLFVETFYNNAIFLEYFNLCKTFGISPFDCLVYMKNHTELYTEQMKKIIAEFLVQTSADLYDSYEETQNHILTPEMIGRYIGGELGINELLVHKALLFIAFADICGVLSVSVREVIREKGLLTLATEQYLDDLKTYVLCKKNGCVTEGDTEHRAWLNYDFEAVEGRDFKVDPNGLTRLNTPVEYRFYHSEDQQHHLKNQLYVYSQSPIGLGRLLQRSNLKLLYRTVERVMETENV